VLFFASAGIAAYAALASVAAQLAVVHMEEPELHARFGERYEDYCRHVPRWIPRVAGRGRGDARPRRPV
jgi:protein-S-isoprenylcysteine O-methyltransferase Ste14